MSLNYVLYVTTLLCFAKFGARAQVPPCQQTWQTVKTDGSAFYKNDTDLGMTCIKSLPNQCLGGPNAQCTYSFRTSRYICCYDVWLAAGGIDYLALNRIAKPICPNGGLSLGGNAAITCDPSKPTACSTGYTCSKAANAATTAFYNPYLCCDTSTINSFATVWSKLGLTPRIVPKAPQQPILSMTFLGTVAPLSLTVNQGDDWSESSVKQLFNKDRPPTTVVIQSNFTALAADNFQLLIFNANDNKNILLFVGDMTHTPTLGTAFTITTAKNVYVYPVGGKNATFSGFLVDAPTGPYKFGPGSYPLPYTTKQTYVALLFFTGARTTDMIGINTAATTTAVPPVPNTFDPNLGFLYNRTVTDFLKAGNGSSLGTGLGAPIAGTYFYI